MGFSKKTVNLVDLAAYKDGYKCGMLNSYDLQDVLENMR